MIVVDTNVLIYSYVENDKRKFAEQMREIDQQWHMPPLWRHEFLNFLAKTVQQRGCTVQAAQKLWIAAFEDFSTCERDVDLALALLIACEHAITAYDAQYIALAHTLGTCCVTEDKLLLKRFPEMTISLEDFCSDNKG